MQLQFKNDVLSQIPAQYQVRDVIQLYSSIIVHGEKYCCGGIIVLRFSNGEPDFGRILALFPFNKTQMMLVQRLRTIVFNDHYYAYQVMSPRVRESFIVSVQTLYSPFMCSCV